MDWSEPQWTEIDWSGTIMNSRKNNCDKIVKSRLTCVTNFVIIKVTKIWL